MSRPSRLTVTSMGVLGVAMALLLSALSAPYWHLLSYKDVREEVSLWGTCTHKPSSGEVDCKRMTGWKIICACSTVLGLVWLIFSEGLTIFYGFFLPDKVTAKYVGITIGITGVYIISGVGSWAGMSMMHDFPAGAPVQIMFSWAFYVAATSCFVTLTAVILMLLEHHRCEPLHLRRTPPALRTGTAQAEPFHDMNDSIDEPL